MTVPVCPGSKNASNLFGVLRNAETTQAARRKNNGMVSGLLTILTCLSATKETVRIINSREELIIRRAFLLKS